MTDEQTKEKPLSENIGHWDGGEYLVTAGIWRVRTEYDLFDTFEIGIRRKSDNHFMLLQSNKWNHQSVQEVANVIGMLLADKTQNYTPEWCQEYLT